jgi:repressor LexA
MAYGKISAKQQQILNFIKSEITQKGYPPTVRNICEAVNLRSTSSVHAHLETLERNGYIRRDPAKPRAIEILDNSFNGIRKNIVAVPIIRKVTADLPITANENIEDYFPLPEEKMPNPNSFMLRIQDDSMIDSGIYNNDLILVEYTTKVSDGDKVVALINDEITVKKFFKENDHIRLQAENKTIDPIIVKKCSILGKVVGVFRFL